MKKTLAISIRLARSEEAPLILDVHSAAVRGIAAGFYDPDVISDWAPSPVPSERIGRLVARLESGQEIMFVAKNDKGKIVGFASVAPEKSELCAVYVHPDYGGQGTGGLLIKKLESTAKEHGLSELKVDGSLNAEQFYLSHGYHVVERGDHILGSGRRMPCVKMKKALAASAR